MDSIRRGSIRSVLYSLFPPPPSQLEDLGVFTVDAELTNARLSMVAFAGMLALEAHFQTSTVNIVTATLASNGIGLGSGLESLLPPAFPMPVDLPHGFKVDLDIPKQLSPLRDWIVESMQRGGAE